MTVCVESPGEHESGIITFDAYQQVETPAVIIPASEQEGMVLSSLPPKIYCPFDFRLSHSLEIYTACLNVHSGIDLVFDFVYLVRLFDPTCRPRMWLKGIMFTIPSSNGSEKGGTEEGCPDTAARRSSIDGQHEKFCLSKHERLVFAALAVLSFMAALDGTSISVALPRISRDLNGSTIEAFWTGTSFLLCSSVSMPIFGALSDVFGRKPLVLAAILLFFIGSVIGSVAQDFTLLLIGRSLQGSGGGPLITLTGIVMADIVPLRVRGKYFGIFSATWSLGSVLGPVLGGCFTEKSTWRWLFYVNFPFIGIGSLLAIFFMSFGRCGEDSLLTRVRRIDYAGSLLFGASTSSFLIPLSWGGIMYPWSSWRTLVPLIIGSIGLCAFLVYEFRYASHPIVPASAFQNRTTTVSFAGYTVMGLTLWCALYYLPLYYEAVRGYSAILAGVAMFPETLTVAPTAVIVGFLINYTGRYRWCVWCGWTLATIGFGLLCLLEATTSIAGWIFLNIVPGIGLGMLIPSVAFAVQASAPQEVLALAVSLSTFFRSFGQSIGVALGGVIFQNRMRSCLAVSPALGESAERYSHDAASVAQILNRMSDGQEKEILREAYVDSLRTVWAVCCAISGGTLVLSLFTQSFSLNKTKVTGH